MSDTGRHISNKMIARKLISMIRAGSADMILDGEIWDGMIRNINTVEREAKIFEIDLGGRVFHVAVSESC